MNAQKNKVKIFPQKFFKNIFSLIFFVVFFLSYLASSQNSYSNDCDDETACGIGRIRQCTAAGNPNGLNFDPTQNGADIMFDLSNPVCLTVIATSYAIVKSAILRMCYVCGIKSYPYITPSPVRDSALIAYGGAKAISKRDAGCGSSVAIATSSFAIALAQISVIYAIAKDVFDSTTVCGAAWTSPDPDKYNISKGNVKSEMEEWIKNNPTATLNDQNYRQWYYGGIEYEDNPNVGDYCEDPTGNNTRSNGHFPRQKYYLRGTQVGNFNCSKYDRLLSNTYINPYATASDYDKAFNCCKKRSQRFICIDYKTRGSSVANSNTLDPMQDNRGVFCQSGSRCTIKGIVFSAAPLEANDSRLICAQTYSLCPYNFTIGKGGTKYCDYFQDGIKNSNGTYTYITADDIAKATNTNNPTNDCNTKSEIRNADCTYNAKAGQCKNYCQYLTHCVVTGASDYQYQSNLDSPYFSQACFNFIGDSRNLTSYNSGFILGSQRHFSAPIAQCFKETIENIFYNLAGHSKCANASEYPQADGTCATGNYLRSGSFTYQKGNQVKDVSFFSGLQNTLQTTVKMVLTLAIMFYGLKLLVAHNMSELKKSDLIMFCIKIGLVMYFATGDAWQTFFFEGVYNSSMVLSKIVFHIESTMPDSKKDGCQFDSTSLGANQYPDGKDYLSIWDTLDCKIARYLGFGPEVSTANIASLIFAGLFTGPYGIYFVVALMLFGFALIAMTIRALHIFLSSVMSIILMVYVSPVIIPTVLFSKTAGIFKKWLSELISFCIQPMILFAYIAIFIVVFDSTVIGSASFVGNPPNKTISCRDVCKDESGNEVTGDADCSQSGHSWVGGTCKNSSGQTVYDDPTCTGEGNQIVGAICKDTYGNDVGTDPDCSKAGHSLVSPYTDSFACLIGINSYSKVNSLETIGIALPSIISLFTDHVKEKILTIIKAAFVMYILYEFMDQIPSITSQLIGGSALPASKASATNMMKSVAGVAEGIRERITRGGIKFGKTSYSTTKDVMKEKIGDSKEDDEDDADSGDTHVNSDSSKEDGGGAGSSGENEGDPNNSG